MSHSYDKWPVREGYKVPPSEPHDAGTCTPLCPVCTARLRSKRQQQRRVREQKRFTIRFNR